MPSSSESEDESDGEADENRLTTDTFENAGESANLNSHEDVIKPLPGSPITWFTSSLLLPREKVGVYSTMLPSSESTLRSLQNQSQEHAERSIAMFMVGGGHFQGTIISLTDSTLSKCSIKASKGFHRYTTRRKQGGAQSSNDNAKGAAQSAGAQIRRYNEIALADDVRNLLAEWKGTLDQCEIILVRASGPSSRKLIYDNGIDKHDARVRGFPINTRRATQAEIIRSFHILTRLQTGTIEIEDVESEESTKVVPKKPINVPEQRVDAVIAAQSEVLVGMIKRDKVPKLRQYVTECHIDVTSFRLEPTKAFRHTPTLIHYASAADAYHTVSYLLDEQCDPCVLNATDQTPFEVAGSKTTRDAFRLWRGTNGNELKWDWDVARIPAALTADQVKAKLARDKELKAAEDVLEAQRRELEMLRLHKEAEQAREAELKEAARKRGPGRSLAMGVLGGSSITNLNGMAPDMKQKIERERRARAAEARFAKK